MTDLASREAQFLLYQAADGRTRIEVRFDGETAWLSLGQMAELFQRDKSVISRHVKNVFDEGELERASVVAESATTAADGKTYHVEHFNLDLIISVGYRVKSHRGTQFRIWATHRLREYIVKGFALDDERLKRGGGGNYFDELLVAHPRHPIVGEGLLAQGARDLRHQHRLRRSGRGIPTLLQDRAEQDALGRARSYGGGDHRRPL